ncbi:RHS domain-containing protein [Burkholderia pyrrocinia]|uniref:RHS domain-containing protein n=1 Tax=Burkholderia pyrrocinia TaxID=60550 RepID=UPI00130E586F|nr:RHS domain-containing protein [Burkholderia pyrrocinia]
MAAFIGTGTDGQFVQVPAKTRNATLFYQNDHLGTQQELVDESRTVVWLGRYRVWGGGTSVSHATSHDRWTDDDVEVTRDETEYRFDNGAIVRRSVEQDRAPSDLLCAECWIDYDVLRHPDAQPVSPTRLTFDNACRETFWLRYHLA